ncbi:MAG TPA: hypothetical protein VGQ89_04490 [Candidatus Limnocylindrales bacterium]|jgi:Tol biopolymer transport system component|nr:hypothetical protein [Candidatus Limnocylindrales bacterium]
MIAHDDFDRMLATWLDETAGAGVPDYLDETLDGLARIGQRPAWMRPWRWLSMQLTMPRVAYPRAMPYLALLALLLALAIVGLAIIGSPSRLPAPFGPASNGRIAYVSDGQLWAADPDGSDARALTFDSSTKGVPVWSRDGTRIAFLEYSVSPNPALVVADADGSHPVTIVQDAEAMRHVSWSQDGNTIAYSLWINYAGQRDRIFLAASDGFSTPKQVGAPDLSAFYPAFSPDSKQVAFVSNLSGPYCTEGDCVGAEEYAMLVMSIDGTDIRKLAHGKIQPRIDLDRYDRLMDWRPDGSSVLFTGHDITKPQVSGVFAVAPNGASEPQRVNTGPGSAYGATWSPDGQRIAFLRGDERSWDVVVSDPDGGNARTLASHVARFPPQWSPDGRSVAFIDGYSDKESAVRITPVDGGGPVIVVPITIIAPASLSAPGVDPVGWQRLAP